ncbi:YihY/virulence factor BrkB family protein [Aquipuribacter sp. SD81]|uniref:YihY/virulence factor BrkB family protein n=1 Tax=Aquipuribacter sp. SD81 TaxID=3127703 RepID=UPI003016AE73
MSVVDTAKGAVGAAMRSRPWRTNERFGQSRGALLSAGIAFFGVFAIFPLLVLGVAVLGLVAGGNEAVQDRTIDIVSDAVPGLIAPDEAGASDAGTDDGGVTEDLGPQGGIVSESDLREAASNRFALGLSAVIGAVTLLFTGLGWIAALREGIRGMFRLPVMALDPVRVKLFDLAVLVSLGLLLVVSAVADLVSTSVGRQLLRLVGLEGSTAGTVALAVVVALLTLALNTVLYAVLFKVLANSGEPLRRVLGGALIAAVGTVLLRQLVGQVLGNVGGGFGFLTPFVGILALFVWLNLTARVMLLGASWVAVGPTSELRPVVEPGEPVVDDAGPTPLPPALPVRWTDRAVLGAGVVLGASAVALVQATGAAVRAVVGGVARARDD